MTLPLSGVASIFNGLRSVIGFSSHKIVCGAAYAHTHFVRLLPPACHRLLPSVTAAHWWLGSVVVWYGVGLEIERSQVRLPAGALSSSNSGQVVHTHVPL